MSRRRPAKVVSPRPPVGARADVFADRLVVPCALVRAFGARDAAVLAVLLAEGAAVGEGTWEELGFDDGEVRDALESLRCSGVVDDTGAPLHQRVAARLGEPPAARQLPGPEAERFAVAERLCLLLADLITANGSRRPTVTATWVADMERAMRIDGRSAEQLEHAILWCQADPFWAPNIESPRTLRRQFDKLRFAAVREGRHTAERKMARARAMVAGRPAGVDEDRRGGWADAFGVDEATVVVGERG